MTDFNSLYQQGLYLSPGQQDLLLAALSSNNPPQKPQDTNTSPQLKEDSNGTPHHRTSGSFSGGLNGLHNQSGGLGNGDDESPFLDFNPELDFDDFQGSDSLIGDIPGSVPASDEYGLGDKRKDTDGKSEIDKEESGKRRRESDVQNKKPGRKPLMSEPTSKRKAQNRAAQRAFRERKEKHLTDLEKKVEDLQKASDDSNQENGLLRAQVTRLQVELKEYRKRLSWITSGNGVSAMSAIPGAYSNNVQGLNNNEFMFDFPRFGDLPGSHIFNNGQNKPKDTSSQTGRNGQQPPGVLSRNSLDTSNVSGSELHALKDGSARSGSGTPKGSSDNQNSVKPKTASNTQGIKANSVHDGKYNHDSSNSDSPSSSCDSRQSRVTSSKGTSPESSTTSPSAGKPNEVHNGHHEACGSIDGESSFCAQLGLACGNIKNPIPVVRGSSASAANTPNQPNTSEDSGLDNMAQQNGGQFDPVLFGDWREPQDAVLSQDFNTFFDDAFPLPDLGSPSYNLNNEVSEPPAQKKTSMADILKLDDDEEVVPGEDQSKMLSCNKIWDRLQSMDKFRSGEIDVDNLCSELRTKARCSEGGVVVNQNDVEEIMGRAK